MRRGSRPPKLFRGSRRRVRRIRMRGNGSPAFWWFVIWTAVALLVIVPKLLTIPSDDAVVSRSSRDTTAPVVGTPR